jgi:hypothetical protein
MKRSVAVDLIGALGLMRLPGALARHVDYQGAAKDSMQLRT